MTPRRSFAAQPYGRSAVSIALGSDPNPPRRVKSTTHKSPPNGTPRRGNEASMSTLICFGLGYSAENFVGMFGDGFEHIVGTVRGAERAALLSAHFSGRLRALVFDGTFATPELRHAIGEMDMALVSVPPHENGDPVLAVFGK